MLQQNRARKQDVPELRTEPRRKRERAVMSCAECGEPVYAGDFYYALGECCLCRACVSDAMRTAEGEFVMR